MQQMTQKESILTLEPAKSFDNESLPDLQEIDSPIEAVSSFNDPNPNPDPDQLSSSRTFGEVYICNENTFGEFFRINELNTFDIQKFQGQEDQLYVFFKDKNDNHQISSIEKVHIQNARYAKDKKSVDFKEAIAEWNLTDTQMVHQICLTTDQLIVRQSQGKIVEVQKGQSEVSISKNIYFPPKIKISEISCGWHHSLALSTDGDIYSWGRSYQGQLGNPLMQYSTSPKSIKFFNKTVYTKNNFVSSDSKKFASGEFLKKFRTQNKATKVFAAANHSFAITDNHEAFGWGDNSMGVLGLPDFIGKSVQEPQKICLSLPFEENIPEEIPQIGTKSLSPIHKHPSQFQNFELPVNSISTCQTHTYFLTQSGRLFVSGLDKGQLGLTTKNLYNRKSTDCHFQDFPVELIQSHNAKILPKFQQISTSFHKSIALSVDHSIFVWGRGSLGVSNVDVVERPCRLNLSEFAVKPTQIIASGSSFALFVPCRFSSLNPKICFSKGGTLCNLLGFGIIENQKKPLVRLRAYPLNPEIDSNNDESPFISKIIPLIYENTLPSYFFMTPNFENEGFEYPLKALVDVSLDGVHFMNTGLSLTILDSAIKLREISPKFLSISGDQTLSVKLDFNKFLGTRNQESSSTAGSNFVTDLLSGDKNENTLMIAFKQIIEPSCESSSSIPNFKNLTNNSIIDNKLFLRQKMIKNEFNQKNVFQDSMSDKTANILDNSKLDQFDSKNDNSKNTIYDLKNHKSKRDLDTDIGSGKNTNNTKTNNWRASTLKKKESIFSETNGWKLVEAFCKDGVVYCKTPKVDMVSGTLQIFGEGGIIEKIKNAGYNTTGKGLLDEVSKWLDSQNLIRETKDDSMVSNLKTLFRAKSPRNYNGNDKENSETHLNSSLCKSLIKKSSILDQVCSQEDLILLINPDEPIYGFHNYWVDLCLNGQQILGRPFKLTFYKIHLSGLFPNNCLHEGSIPIYFRGQGIFESDFKKVKIKAGDYERIIEPEWNAVSKIMFFYMPPFDWLKKLSETNENCPSEEFMVKCIQGQAKVFDHSSLKSPDQSKKETPVELENSIPDEDVKKDVITPTSKETPSEVENSETTVIEPEKEQEVHTKTAVQIFLALSENDWRLAGEVMFYEPIIDEICLWEEPETISEIKDLLVDLKEWEYFSLVFPEGFEPTVSCPKDVPTNETKTISEEILTSKNTKSIEPTNRDAKSKKKEDKKDDKKDSKDKDKKAADKGKEAEKKFATMKSKMETQICFPDQILILTSKTAFILPSNTIANVEKPINTYSSSNGSNRSEKMNQPSTDTIETKVKFFYKKYEIECQGTMVNRHMITCQLPELPFDKPRPIPSSEESENIVEEMVETSKTPKANTKPPKSVQNIDEYNPYELVEVGVKLSLNGMQFGRQSQAKLKYMIFDKDVQTEERLNMRQLQVNTKKK